MRMCPGLKGDVKTERCRIKPWSYLNPGPIKISDTYTGQNFLSKYVFCDF